MLGVEQGKECLRSSWDLVLWTGCGGLGHHLLNGEAEAARQQLGEGAKRYVLHHQGLHPIRPYERSF
jgi:hypothetical protein